METDTPVTGIELLGNADAMRLKLKVRYERKTPQCRSCQHFVFGKEKSICTLHSFGISPRGLCDNWLSRGKSPRTLLMDVQPRGNDD
jgi:ribosomal protein L37E